MAKSILKKDPSLLLDNNFTYKNLLGIQYKYFYVKCVLILLTNYKKQSQYIKNDYEIFESNYIINVISIDN